MTTKVQGSIAAAVQNMQTTPSVSSPVTQVPGSARRISDGIDRRIQPDGFDRRPPLDIDRILGGRRPAGLPLGDRFTASDLHRTLSDRLNNVLLSTQGKSETLTRDQNGIFRGPNGQPLVPVQLDDGNTAYVDPNTNRYYLTNEQPGKGGTVRALPAIDLPQDSQFSNRYFNDQDARDLTQIAESHQPFGPRPQPQPLPWPDRPRPEPVPWRYNRPDDWLKPLPSPRPERPRHETPDYGPLRGRDIAV